jgi:hypothetical protein
MLGAEVAARGEELGDPDAWRRVAKILGHEFLAYGSEPEA